MVILKSQLRLLLLSCILFVNINMEHLKAQSPTDGIMMKSGQLCLAGIFNQQKWDTYWEGTQEKVNGNIGTFTSNSYAGMFNLGLTNKFNLIMGIPYISNKASAGYIIEQKGFQNLSLFLKAQLLDKKIAAGQFLFLATTGINTPVNKYVPDAAYSLGLGCSEFSIRPIIQYKHNTGLFLRLNAAYSWRGTSTLSRDYYFTTTGYYSDVVDIPNALDYEATLGYLGFGDKLKVEINYSAFDTQGGFDIRKHDGGFPSNEMDFTLVGGNVKYWLPWVKGLGLEVFGKHTLDGRNVGKANSLGFAINYFFSVCKKKDQQS